MSQQEVCRYYATRKRFKDVIKNVEVEQSSKLVSKTAGVQLETDVKSSKIKRENVKVKTDRKKKTLTEKKVKPTASLKKNSKQSSVSGKQQDIITALLSQDKKKSSKSKTAAELKESNSEPSSLTCVDEVSTHNNAQSDLPQTPKRNLSEPDELTPSKKQHIVNTKTLSDNDFSNLKSTSSSTEQSVRRKLLQGSSSSKIPSKSAFLNETKNADNIKYTPKKHSVLALNTNSVTKTKPINKEIVITSVEGSEISSNKHSPQQSSRMVKLDDKSLVSLIKQSRSKILASGNLDELKKSFQKFSKGAAAAQQFQVNSCKITDVIATHAISKEQTFTSKNEPAKTKFSHLASSESLTLPYKYKLLCEIFRCMDTVVSILHNRKERITFDKLQEGVQKMNNRSFTKTHIGQIMSVLPSAYSLHYEKNDNIIHKRNVTPNYQLIIEPNLTEDSTDSVSNLPQSSKFRKQSKSNAFVHMSPQHLMERRSSFHQNILKVTKKHHEEFLTRIRFNGISSEKILRWHPKFQLDFVPDIKCEKLPETPEIKMCTAKDVLNKLRGTVKGRIHKALESVAEESKVETKTDELSNKASTTLNRKPSSALKGICTDLLEKIRARENAKLVESMMRSPDEAKRLAMLENVPKIVHILWHYFVAERKAAIPVDVAIEKIIHSLNSQKTPDEIREYLQLVTETCPGWLSFIKIPKGEYITMDKRKDINVMLDNIKH